MHNMLSALCIVGAVKRLVKEINISELVLHVRFLTLGIINTETVKVLNHVLVEVAEDNLKCHWPAILALI